jgi:hypothetical protein
MPRSRCSLAFSVTLGLAVLAGPLLPGCGGTEEAKPPMKEEDTPAAKSKGSMDYFRNNMNKKGATK